MSSKYLSRGNIFEEFIALPYCHSIKTILNEYIFVGEILHTYEGS